MMRIRCGSTAAIAPTASAVAGPALAAAAGAREARSVSPDTSVVPFRFSTNDVPPRERIAVSRDVLGRLYLRLDPEPADGAPLCLTIERHDWSSVSLIYSETNPICFQRTPDLVRDADGDFRFVVGVEGARYHFASGGIEEVMDGADAALLFNGAVCKVSLLGTCRSTAIRIPRERLAAATQELDERPIRRAPPGCASLRLLSGYVALLRRQGPTADPVLAHQIASHLVDLVALTLGPTEETRLRARGGATRMARLAAIRADVLANLAEMSLSAKTIGRRHGVTDRYVHLLFEENGQTFGRFVEEERLKRAFALLADPTQNLKRIGEIATEVGFAEHSTFDRAFRRRFGDTPSGVRRRHIPGWSQ
jgi:AraC-like DNA-binding protein